LIALIFQIRDWRLITIDIIRSKNKIKENPLLCDAKRDIKYFFVDKENAKEGERLPPVATLALLGAAGAGGPEGR
jgi:hypothetical protein